MSNFYAQHEILSFNLYDLIFSHLKSDWRGFEDNSSSMIVVRAPTKEDCNLSGFVIINFSRNNLHLYLCQFLLYMTIFHQTVPVNMTDLGAKIFDSDQKKFGPKVSPRDGTRSHSGSCPLK